MKKAKKLHMIGHAHIDPVWHWRWMEGFQEVKATFRSALDRMEEYPDFRFTASSAIFYEWVEKNDPKMFEEIRKRVEEGRWELVGGWVIEPDCNIPGGEALVRQGLYGQRYMKEKFGKTATTGFNADSFGHNGSLPQILLKSGLNNYVFMRPMPSEKSLPGRIFWWRSADGSKVMAYRIPYEYCSWGKDLERYYARIKTELNENVDELMFFYGVGNHGGGPTKENIESIGRLNAQEETDLEMSTTGAFFAGVRQSGHEYPVVQDDLQHHASGCYSAHSGIKKWNRTVENLLVTAEKLSAIAKTVEGLPYPEDYAHGWKSMLFNQFHDILAGTSCISAYEDARDTYGEAAAIARRNGNNALQAISWDINIEEDVATLPLVVFNPHSWAGKMACEIEVRGLKQAFKLTDDSGNVIPAQIVQSESLTNQRRLVFVADLPSMGYRVYRLYRDLEVAPEFPAVKATDCMLENERFRLEINPDTGNVKSYYDKEQQVEIFVREGARLAVIDNPADTWAHNVFKFDREIGNMKPVYARKVEEGPVRSTIRVKYRHNDSYIWQDFRVYRELEHVEVRVKVDWREPRTMVKLKFPVRLNMRKPTMEIPYGYIEKTINGEEEAGQSWVDLSGVRFDNEKVYGFAVANTAKYSYDFNVDEIGVTILNNSIYDHHDPAVPDAEKEYTYLDSGSQSFLYAMLPHAGTWKESSIIQTAQVLNTPPAAMFETFHKGTLPLSRSFLSVESPQVIVSALKEAEDKDGIVVRMYETMKLPVETVLNAAFLGRSIPLRFEPCEIKTLHIPYDAAKEPGETNLLEW